MRRSQLHAAPTRPAKGPAKAAAPTGLPSPTTDDPILERCIEQTLALYRPHLAPEIVRVLGMDLIRFLTTEPGARKLVARARGHLVAKSGDVTQRSGDQDDDGEEDLGEEGGLALGGRR
jgi:hypothetical protein